MLSLMHVSKPLRFGILIAVLVLVLSQVHWVGMTISVPVALVLMFVVTALLGFALLHVINHGVSNGTMMSTALLVIPTEFIVLTIYSRLLAEFHPATGLLGNLDYGIRALAVLGILSVLTVLAVLILGLRKDAKKKAAGAIACVLVLAVLLIQAIYFTSGWIKYG
jgi:hypothetical protein